MSRWMELLSEIKRRPVEEYLTPTQRLARDRICEILQHPNRVNLYGPHGGGKTYVAWSIVRAIGATHVPVPERLAQLSPGHECLIIDNVPHHETDVRRLLAISNLLNASSVVLITHLPVAMPLHRVELPLPTAEEVETVLKTYARFGYYRQHQLPDAPGFWDILLACV